ncbi:MAG: hypothetical protein WC712_04185 [Candidatus Brocadiia bacterium]
MKTFKIILLLFMICVIAFIVYAFTYYRGLKEIPDWYVTPEAMPTRLAESIVSRSKINLQNAYATAPVGTVFEVRLDIRVLEAYLIDQQDIESKGILKPHLEVVGDKVRFSTVLNESPLQGAVVFTMLTLTPTKDGDLLVTPSPIMVGSKQLPDFVLSNLEEQWKHKWEPVVISAEELGIKARLLAITLTHDPEAEIVIKAKKVK